MLLHLLDGTALGFICMTPGILFCKWLCYHHVGYDNYSSFYKTHLTTSTDHADTGLFLQQYSLSVQDCIQLSTFKSEQANLLGNKFVSHLLALHVAASFWCSASIFVLPACFGCLGLTNPTTYS